MVDRLVHGSYPVDYFSLENVDRIMYPRPSWWASRQRFAAYNPNKKGHEYLPISRGGERTEEYLEIDLGRVRQVNFLTMQVFKVPVNIAIEYDSVSAQDGTHTWADVRAMQEMEYDSKVRYRPDHKNPFAKCNFYFTDRSGHMVHTRYLRIRFSRVDVRFPTRRHKPIRYSIMVKGLRTARVVAGLKDTIGPIFNSGIDANTTPFGLTPNRDPDLAAPGASEIIKQNFVVPESARRGAVAAEETDTSVFPSILGLGVLVFDNTDFNAEGEEETNEADLFWEVRDVTDPEAEVILRRGHHQGTPNVGRTWVDFYFEDRPIDADPVKVYQLRIYSQNMNVVGSMYQRAPNNVPGRALPGTLAWVAGSASITTTSDTTGVVAPGDRIMKPSGEGGVFEVQSVNATTITLTGNFTGVSESAGLGVVVMPMLRYDETAGDYVADYTRNLTVRLWGDVSDSGRDILGNEYRYATHRDKAANVFDGTRAGWVSAPQPDPRAVESLYFDVRSEEAGVKKLTVIDALRVAPLVPGTTMHVYYCDGWLNSTKPQNVSNWEALIWKPVPWTFQLRADQQFRLPTQIAAAYIKLEFTNLKPRSFHIPRYPALPPVRYRRYPTWVEAQFANAQVRRVVNDWFVRHRTKVMRNVLKRMDDPLARFQYKLREFLAALALGKIGRRERAVKEGLVDLKKGAFIDPITASKIYVSGPRTLYKGTLKVNLDRDSLLGQVVANLHDPRLVGDPVEGEVEFSSRPVVPFVSSLNDRVTYSYAHLAQSPMWFNRPSRHRYRREIARFNKKAYFAGVAEVDFLRSDFTVARDDEVITETFADEEMIDSNTFELETITNIASGQTIYVSYDIPNPGSVQDEEVLLEGTTPVQLTESGDDPAMNFRVFAGPNYTGEEYVLGEDYDLSFDVDENGKVRNYIERNTTYTRTKVRRPAEGYTNIDAGMVVGQARVPIIRGYEDENVVVGRAIIFSATAYTDAASVSGIGVPVTTQEIKGWDDAAITAGVAVPSGPDVYERGDVGTVTGDGVPSGVDTADLRDPATGDFLDAPLATDLFTRSVAGWGTATDGKVWTTESGFSTDGEAGLIEPGLANQEGRLALVTKRANVRVRADVSWNVPASGNDHQFSLLGRVVSTTDDTYYRVRIDQQIDGSVRLTLTKEVHDTNTNIAGPLVIASSYTLDSVYKLRFEVTGTTIRAKAWLEGTSEPGTWQLETTDSEPELQVVGDLGVRASRSTGSTANGLVFRVDNFLATTDVSIPVGVAVPITTTELREYAPDAATVAGVAVPSGVNSHGYPDAGSAVGVATASSVDSSESVDAAFSNVGMIEDTFNRTLVDQWGFPEQQGGYSTDDWQLWVLPGRTVADFDVTPGMATIQIPTGSNGSQYALVAENAPGDTIDPNGEFLCKVAGFSTPAPDAAAETRFQGVIFRHKDGSNYSKAGIRYRQIQGGITMELEAAIEITKDLSSVTLSGGWVTTNDPSKDVWLRVRVVGNNTIQLRLWFDGDPEPSTWRLSWSDPTWLGRMQGQGRAGFFGKRYETGDVTWVARCKYWSFKAGVPTGAAAPSGVEVPPWEIPELVQSNGSYGKTGTASCAWPQATAATGLPLAVLHIRDEDGTPPVPTTPGGWALVASRVNGASAAYMYRKTSTASGSLNVTLNDTCRWTLQLFEYSGIEGAPATSTPDKTATASGNGSTDPVSGTTAVTAQAHELLVAVLAIDNDNGNTITLTNPTNEFEEAHVQIYLQINDLGHTYVYHRMVEATGAYSMGATLSPNASDKPWEGLIATFRARQN